MTRTIHLKKREKAVMDAIVVLTQRLQRDPSVGELSKHTRLTPHQVGLLLGRLGDKGIVKKTGTLQ